MTGCNNLKPETINYFESKMNKMMTKPLDERKKLSAKLLE